MARRGFLAAASTTWLVCAPAAPSAIAADDVTSGGAPAFMFRVEDVKRGDGSASPAKGDLVVVEFVAVP
jgi:hypothetical protein